MRRLGILPWSPAPAPAMPSTDSPTPALHPFDAAVRLTPEHEDAAEGRYRGATSPAYANMIGPFGGTTAATLLNAACIHPARIGEPVALTVNFAGPIADGEFSVTARAVRTNRSTQHWSMALSQGEDVAATATAVFAVRRETWSATDAAFPQVPGADTQPRATGARVAFTDNYDMRFVRGAPVPRGTHGEREASPDSVTTLWLRDEPPRPLDVVSLAALCDVFFPRIFLRRPKFVPASTVSITTYFHAGAAELARQGARHLLGTAKALAFGNGYHDQTAEVWSDDGVLLAASHQVVYYKE